MKQNKLVVYALHPIIYQSPIFKELSYRINEKSLQIQSMIYYGDDLSLREVYFKEINTRFKPDVDFLMDGYNYKFLKNYAKDSRSGFLSRVNPGIYKELKNEKYDAILIHGYDRLTAWMAMISAKLTNTKIIWRGEAVLRGVENDYSFKQNVKRFIVKKFFNSCDAILYSCTGNKEYLKFYGVEDEKLFSIPCAVNNDFFQIEREKYIDNILAIKKELGIDIDDMVILFSARFTKRKRPLDLLNALTKIDHSNITVLFVGDGLERGNMESFVKENNLKAIFTGFQNQTQLPKYYTISDIDMVISDYDPSPKAMNEAMNFRLPIIVSDAPGTAYDLVIDGENGFIVKVGDIDDIASKIDYFNKNRGVIKTMGDKSFDIVQKWNYEEDVKGILEAFNYVVGEKKLKKMNM
jgi:glycosyltransferase involved in cell wall biosynthesis